MSGFDALHPSIQHHVVNSLGWRDLRPLQEQAVDPILAGVNCLLLAPTAGGKTEAAILPVLSAMLTNNWKGLTVLYICPLRALLNNLEERLSYYANLVGRRCGLWHGDVAQALKSRMLADPPDILLTTPESLEAILISRRTDKAFFFGNLQAVVVDEIHAFAGDDRGWHLLCLLERIGKLAKRDFLRVGLSATVGNPDRLLSWLCSGSDRGSRVVAPPAVGPSEAEVTVDFVGDLHNAVHVLKVLHRGEKRLVFCDSRARCEELANLLRAAHLNVFVSHSSLSAEQRREAEAAFRDARDCIIVATSTLELGIDVGDLDRVVQIDSPTTVGSFLQRLGRTGRRPGAKRNCLFLTTSDESLLQATAIVELWRDGFVEPLEPPPIPYNVIAQQIMAICLEQKGISMPVLFQSLERTLKEMSISPDTVRGIVSHMLQTGILVEDSGIFGIGSKGEQLYGARNFIGLMSVFDTPPLVNVFWGPRDLGSVHPISLRQRNDEPVVLSLGGRSWRVSHFDAGHNTVSVVPVDDRGRSRWLGTAAPLSFKLCQKVKSLLLGSSSPAHLSKRAAHRISEIADDTAVDRNGVVPDALGNERLALWTFAGLRGNHGLSKISQTAPTSYDNFSIRFSGSVATGGLWSETVVRAEEPAKQGVWPSSKVKFSECLDASLMSVLQQTREIDDEAVAFIRNLPIVARRGKPGRATEELP